MSEVDFNKLSDAEKQLYNRVERMVGEEQKGKLTPEEFKKRVVKRFLEIRGDVAWYSSFEKGD